MHDIAHQLKLAVETGEDLELFHNIKGFLAPAEGHALMLLAAMGPGRGAVVEIGSYLGRSTSYLALGARASKRGKIFAVDHFLGSPEHQPGKQHQEEVLIKDGTLYKQFMANLKFHGLDEQVIPISAPSPDAARQWDGRPIRLLFIDGEHSYEATRSDFQAWESFVEREGVIVFHDVGESWPGVTRFFTEATASTGDWHCSIACGSLRAIRRRQALFTPAPQPRTAAPPLD